MRTLKYTLPVFLYLVLLSLAWAKAVPLYFLILLILTFPGMSIGVFGEAELRAELKFFYTNRRMQQIKMASALCFAVFNGMLLWLVAERPFGSLNFTALLLATALSNGMFMLSLAHELTHASHTSKRRLGNLLLFMVCLPFFRADHIFGHHEQIGTAKDAGSARVGQSFYHFLGRVFLQRIRRSYSRRSDLPQDCRASVQQYNLLFTSLLAFFAMLLFLIQPVLLLFWLGQSVLVYVLYEMTNYVQHYGLRRSAGVEVGLEHSWNSYYKYVNLLSWFLWVHSPHHLERPLAEKSLLTGPQLPFLPYKMLLLALFPPVWFRIMNPLISRMHKRLKPSVKADSSKITFSKKQNHHIYDPAI